MKCAVGYWQAIHNKAISREKKLKQVLKKPADQTRDPGNRLFEKKVIKKVPVKMKVNQNPRRPNILVVSNPAVKGMDAQNPPIFL